MVSIYVLLIVFLIIFLVASAVGRVAETRVPVRLLNTEMEKL
jgi:hypothetical protein